MSDELPYKVVYKEQVFGYNLGGFIIDVARAIGSIHENLPRFEYAERLSRARSMMQALLAAIPEAAYSGINPHEVIDKVEKMGRKELLKLLFEITSMLDRKGLLIKKKKIPYVEEEESVS